MGFAGYALMSGHRNRKVRRAAGAAAAIAVTAVSAGPLPAAQAASHGPLTSHGPLIRVAGSPDTASTDSRAAPAFPGCAWPVETTPATANVAAPDPYATYWTTPFRASPHDSITITGVYPTSRFMSFAVYNDSFQLFSNTVHGKSVPSDLSDYQINANRGSRNPWRTGRVSRHRAFTVRLRPQVTAERQHAANAIPMIDQNPPTDPAGPPGLGYVIFRTYIPAGGNTAVRLPAITITRNGHSTTLRPCTRPDRVTAGPDAARTGMTAAAANSPGAGRHSSVPALQYFGPSAASAAGLFPNPVNAYLIMEFTPEKGYVVVTHGKAPTSPVQAGHGVPGNTIGASPVPWIRPGYQVRYWSIANYLNAQPYPVVKVGRGSRAVYGGTPDYLTTLRNGYYTVVSSLPADKPSAASLKASAATWIPTSASRPGSPEFQLLRNMLSQQALYPEGFTFIPPPASPEDDIPPATVRQHMGAYYPQTARCTVQTFESSGWAGCLAAFSRAGR
ncbi:MAG: hypothetical protein ACHP9Z_04015 [Streptosporangiales bacterium]